MLLAAFLNSKIYEHGHVVLAGHVVEVSTSKTGKHGH